MVINNVYQMISLKLTNEVRSIFRTHGFANCTH